MKALMRLCLCVFTMASASAGIAFADGRTREAGPYLIRANLITADELPADVAARHGIRPSPKVAVLNVVVQKKTDSGRQTVPAHVEASKRNLLGQVEKLAMRPARANQEISYFGSFEFDPRQVVRVEVEVLPEGASKSETLSFDEKLFGRAGPK